MKERRSRSLPPEQKEGSDLKQFESTDTLILDRKSESRDMERKPWYKFAKGRHSKEDKIFRPCTCSQNSGNRWIILQLSLSHILVAACLLLMVFLFAPYWWEYHRSTP